MEKKSHTSWLEWPTAADACRGLPSHLPPQCATIKAMDMGFNQLLSCTFLCPSPADKFRIVWRPLYRTIVHHNSSITCPPWGAFGFNKNNDVLEEKVRLFPMGRENMQIDIRLYFQRSLPGCSSKLVFKDSAWFTMFWTHSGAGLVFLPGGLLLAAP
jgi:hypothetical protein